MISPLTPQFEPWIMNDMPINDHTLAVNRASGNPRAMTCLFALLAAVLLAPPTSAAPAVMARFSTDRTNIWAGEAFQLTLEFRITNATLDKQINVADFPPGLQLHSLPEEIAGENYQKDDTTVEIRRFRTWARVPKAGSLTITPRLDGMLIQTSRTIFSTQQTMRRVQIPCEPFSIVTKMVPASGPTSGFSGLVGNFTFQTAVDPLDIAMGDLITVTTSVTGDWLPEDFAMPSVAAIPGLKVYESKLVPEECSPTRRVCRQTLIPETPLVKAIPALRLITFDTSEARFRIQEAGPFPLSYHAEKPIIEPLYIPTNPASGLVTTSTVTASTHATSTTESLWSKLTRKLKNHPEFISQGNTEITVRVAPSEVARELFTLKPGARVTVDSVDGDWNRISCQQGIGWIPANRLKSASVR